MKYQLTRMNKVDKESLLAFIDVVLEEVIVHGIGLRKDKTGDLYITMPSQKGKDGKWYEIVSMKDVALKNELKEAIIKKYMGEDEVEQNG